MIPDKNNLSLLECESNNNSPRSVFGLDKVPLLSIGT